MEIKGQHFNMDLIKPTIIGSCTVETESVDVAGFNSDISLLFRCVYIFFSCEQRDDSRYQTSHLLEFGGLAAAGRDHQR
jgi:hypothetical protein